MNAKDQDGVTALMAAALGGHPDIVRILIENRVEVYARANDGTTALMRASTTNNADTVQLLIGAGADVNAWDFMGWTPLLNAASFGHTKVIDTLLQVGAEVDQKNHEGRTPLSWAAGEGFDDSVRTLLSAGANVNGRDNIGLTALMWASETGQIDTAQILIDSGAEVNLLAADREREVFRGTAIGGETISATIARKQDESLDTGWTALMAAAAQGHIQIAEVLIRSGADVNAVSNDNLTALELARESENEEMAAILQAADAEMTNQDTESGS